jgi:alcohol dehydrogenase class IV
VANPADTEAAEKMLVASCLAGQAFTNGGLGLAHSMGEPLGAFFHVSHGLSCAIYLPVIMDFNLPAAPDKFCAVARALGEDVDWAPPHRSARLAVSAVRDLFEDIGLPLTFKQAGIDFKLHQKMIDDVWPQFSTKCNPRKADSEQVASLYMAPGRED